MHGNATNGAPELALTLTPTSGGGPVETSLAHAQMSARQQQMCLWLFHANGAKVVALLMLLLLLTV